MKGSHDQDIKQWIKLSWSSEANNNLIRTCNLVKVLTSLDSRLAHSYCDINLDHVTCHLFTCLQKSLAESST